MTMKYSIDTSAILEGYNRLYPPDVFPKLWDNLEGIVQSGKLRATEMVLVELDRKDDEVKKWAKSQKEMFLQVDEKIQEYIAKIMGKYPRIVAEGGQKNMADPFVVAFAKQHNLTVITAEKNIGSDKKPSIPYICQGLDVECISFLDLIRREKWSF
jgi:predicted nuclease of predicted toxin-antitoxin system